MNKSHNYHDDDIIEEEPSNEEKLLLSHMNSEDLYQDENVQNLEIEDDEKVRESQKVDKKDSSRNNEGKLGKTPENGHKNLEDSLEIQNEQVSVSNNVSFIKKAPEKSFKSRNEKVDIPRRDKTKSRNANTQSNSLNISNDRYSQHENRNNTDEDEVSETRIMLKRNKSTYNVESNTYNKSKKKKENQDKLTKSPLGEFEKRQREREEIRVYESKEIEEKEISLNDGNLQFNPGNSMKNLPIVHSSMQYQPTPNLYNQYIPPTINQFTNHHHMESNMNPLMNSGYMMSNTNNPYLQANLHNPFQFNQFGYNAYSHQIPMNTNHHYMNQTNQQPFNYNMSHIQNSQPHIQNPGISSQELMQLKVNITNLESENLALKQKINEFNKLQSLNKSKEKEHSEILKENYQMKLIIETLELDNKALLQEIEEMKNNNYETDKLDEIEKNYNMIIKSKDELLKKSKDEIEKLKFMSENMKKEITKLKNGNQNFEKEKSSYDEKITILEEEKETLNKRLQAEGINFNNLREDFDNLVKKYQALKSQNDYTQNLLEEFKSDNYYLKKEVEHLTRKSQNISLSKTNQSVNSDTRTEKSNGGSKSDESTLLTEASDVSQSNKSKQLKNEEMNKNKEINLEINKVQQKIAQLVVEKNKIENDLFKLPDKPRTMNVIQKQQALEQKLQGVEMEINKYKTKVREMKNQLNLK